MTIQEFLNQQEEPTKTIFTTLDNIIRNNDPNVAAEVGSIMSEKEALVYKQEGVFKYGITSTKNHFSFHSMVMYAYPEVAEDIKNKSGKMKFQKGCINFKDLGAIDLSAFESFVEQSASKDFSPVIERYKKKQKA